MPKDLLQQAIDANDVPKGTIMKPGKNGFKRLIRPKHTKCPFGKQHGTARECWIQDYEDCGSCGYQIGCWGKNCKEKKLRIVRDTQGGLTDEEKKAIEESSDKVPVWTADMF